ncbi:unnamed protein product [Bursaphelenchus xylophilus]|uniref:(pine wood nematode) hypothetical protein n=1 Tax=Bursaphelenchus xylophilus TaxID=6326 RepID=A0A1I7RYR9_BURXY|nr:unnamed protein product [Bursaphelenchus xylophilus]CAG9092327.1 unnamed protein product [Bursaphelenchus xylophilus]
MIVRTLLLLSAACLAAVSADCVDKKTNVVRVIDGTNGLPITTQDGAASTYDSKSQPSCHGNEPDVKFPGSVRALSGFVKVSKPLKLVDNSRVLLTLKKNSFMIGTVCENGRSRHVGIPSKYCQPEPCKFAAGLCTLLEKPGTYDLSQLEESIGINGTLALPKLPPALKGIIKGEWKVEGKLLVDNQVVAHIKVPQGNGWIYLEEE